MNNEKNRAQMIWTTMVALAIAGLTLLQVIGPSSDARDARDASATRLPARLPVKTVQQPLLR